MSNGRYLFVDDGNALPSISNRILEVFESFLPNFTSLLLHRNGGYFDIFRAKRGKVPG